MKRVVLSIVVAGALALPFGGVAFADNNASSCGATHGAFANENGDFGWLGELGGTPGYHNAVGQMPGATGYNNSNTNCQAN